MLEVKQPLELYSAEQGFQCSTHSSGRTLIRTMSGPRAAGRLALHAGDEVSVVLSTIFHTTLSPLHTSLLAGQVTGAAFEG